MQRARVIVVVTGVDIQTTVNNITANHVPYVKLWMSSIAMEMQQRLPFAVLSSYKVFRIAVNNISVFQSSCDVLDILRSVDRASRYNSCK